MAEGLLRAKVMERRLSITTDSAGTGDSHLGQAPDRRGQAEMKKHGIDISDLRARLFTGKDFERFDLLLGDGQPKSAGHAAPCPIGGTRQKSEADVGLVAYGQRRRRTRPMVRRQRRFRNRV
jgi:protein-tyrosine-phosphatase